MEDSDMTDILPDHSHCINCDDPIPVDEKFCSDLCKDEYESKAKKESRRMNYFYIAAIAIVIIISLAVYVLGG
jgi:predicted nucleic acid-binding Zn ribbon protein